jgi:hypothetical protein
VIRAPLVREGARHLRCRLCPLSDRPNSGFRPCARLSGRRGDCSARYPGRGQASTANRHCRKPSRCGVRRREAGKSHSCSSDRPHLGRIHRTDRVARLSLFRGLNYPDRKPQNPKGSVMNHALMSTVGINANYLEPDIGSKVVSISLAPTRPSNPALTHWVRHAPSGPNSNARRSTEAGEVAGQRRN